MGKKLPTVTYSKEQYDKLYGKYDRLLRDDRRWKISYRGTVTVHDISPEGEIVVASVSTFDTGELALAEHWVKSEKIAKAELGEGASGRVEEIGTRNATPRKSRPVTFSFWGDV